MPHLPLLAFLLVGQGAPDDRVFPLDAIGGLEPIGVDVAAVEHRERECVRVTEKEQGAGESLVILPQSELRDGVIEVELAGRPRADAQPNMRGFVGIAFRVRGVETLEYECFYLRPTNARADDQLRRNHTTQYVSHPEHPWFRLRRESPGRYESYVDLEPDAWTDVRIEVSGRSAKLFLHGREQPALVVPELLGDAEYGAVALWIGTGTEAHFRNLRVRPARSR